MIFLILSVFLYSNINYEVTWQNSGRVHSEFEWYTIKTENFNVHYHKDIESIATAGANIAEQVLPILLGQVELDSIPVIDIILTTEDEIMNGFATFTNTTFIWVDQNDAAIWLEDQKWLEQVIAHELQHIVCNTRFGRAGAQLSCQLVWVAPVLLIGGIPGDQGPRVDDRIPKKLRHLAIVIVAQ